MPSLEINSGSADAAPQVSAAEMAQYRTNLSAWHARQESKSGCQKLTESCQMGAAMFIAGAGSGAAMAAIVGLRDIPLLTASMVTGALFGLCGACQPDPKPSNPENRLNRSDEFNGG